MVTCPGCRRPLSLRERSGLTAYTPDVCKKCGHLYVATILSQLASLPLNILFIVGTFWLLREIEGLYFLLVPILGTAAYYISGTTIRVVTYAPAYGPPAKPASPQKSYSANPPWGKSEAKVRRNSESSSIMKLEGILLSLQTSSNSLDESQIAQEVSADDALKAFDSVNWNYETSVAERQMELSPTIALEAGEWKLWISGVSSEEGVYFISECKFPSEETALFGMLKHKIIKTLDASAFTQADARIALKLFTLGDTDGLTQLYNP